MSKFKEFKMDVYTSDGVKTNVKVVALNKKDAENFVEKKGYFLKKPTLLAKDVKLIVNSLQENVSLLQKKVEGLEKQIAEQDEFTKHTSEKLATLIKNLQ